LVIQPVNSSILRLIDANANRAREALRVMEDYARFIRNDAALCESLKRLRHDLTEALREVVAGAILQRDTPGDVGTSIKAEGELCRSDLRHVVVAAGKRLGEALRALEEYLKISSPGEALKVEGIRYRFYAIESLLARTLEPAISIAAVRLYVLITESACRGDWLETAEAAIRGGADCLQLREKELGGAEFLSRAKQLVALCRKHGVISIINDRADIALLAEADGVHVGQDDLPCAEARRMLGPAKLIGVSTHRFEQAMKAVADGADYIGVGPIYRSMTKPRDFVAGLEYAKACAAEISIPSVAIAGITMENVGEVMSTGIRAVAVTAAVAGCEDVEGAARRMKQMLTAPAQAIA
jgi:thiamine-phosphate pyrophosphorylase